ncbi:GGDEF domain-containing protein [Paenibacillus paridis]|uniref:GGDEF domain-containing protein n=1 Tax=Paenibacillus paridis TaxID=2583376 RepID=UPI0011205218|nr:GGDEF domain-containing protein [Paenibacillus paridis]
MTLSRYNNNNSWNRWVLYFYWVLSTVVLTITECIHLVRFGGKAWHEGPLFPEGYGSASLSMLLSLLLAEVLYRYMKRYFDYILITMGLVYAVIVMLTFGREVHGLYIGLDLPIIVALFYFSHSRLWFAAVLTLSSYMALRVMVEPFKTYTGLLDLIAIIGMVMGTSLVGLAILKRGNELQHALERAVTSEIEAFADAVATQNASKYDHLTGLYNHITYQEYLTALIQQHEIYQLPLQLAVLDIDNFKSINDSFGHHAGDLVLREMALLLQECLSTEDVAARYGGEEFVLLLTGKSTEQSHQLLEKIREKLASTAFSVIMHQRVTISVGMVEYQAGQGKDDLFQRADAYLYEAKRTGKNRVVSPHRKGHEDASQISECS